MFRSCQRRRPHNRKYSCAQSGDMSFGQLPFSQLHSLVYTLILPKLRPRIYCRDFLADTNHGGRRDPSKMELWRSDGEHYRATYCGCTGQGIGLEQDHAHNLRHLETHTGHSGVFFPRDCSGIVLRVGE